MAKELPTPEYLKAILSYDPKNGSLTWRPRTPDMFPQNKSRPPEWHCAAWNAAYAGKEAFTADNGHGYGRGTVSTNGKNRQLLAHRVAWAIHYGHWPNAKLDHIDNDRRNNSIDNLRLADDRQNAQNVTSAKGSSSKYLGVHWRPSRAKRPTDFKGRWVAVITVDRVMIRLGLFDTEQSAALAYDKAARMHFGAFANTNFD